MPIGPAQDQDSPLLTLPLDQVGIDHCREAGGKAANLGRLIQAGLPVPNGFCITVVAFGGFLNACPRRKELEQRLAGLSSLPHSQLATTSQQITAWLDKTPIPEEIACAVLTAWGNQGDEKAYAVRSSATIEDGATRSFAGQFESILNVQDHNRLLEAMKRCWLSLFSAPALAYHRTHQLNPNETGMAVVIQEMVPASVSGVLFTLDPQSGDTGKILIESTSGLGDKLVAGRVTPDTFVLDKSGLHIIPGSQNSPPPGLSKTLCHQLASFALETEQLFGRPVDIEWAVAGSQVYLLQARPITTTRPPQPKTSAPSLPEEGPLTSDLGSPDPHLSTATRRPSTEGYWAEHQVWSNANSGEILPDVITPASWSLIRSLLDRLFTSVFRLVGADVTRAPLIDLVAGRVYFNVNTALALTHPFRKGALQIPLLDEALGGAHVNLIQQGLLDIPADQQPNLGFSWPRYIRSWPRILWDILTHLPHRGDAWTEQLKALSKTRGRPDYSTMPVEALLQRFEQFRTEGFLGWDLLYLCLQGAALPIFHKACRDWLDDSDLSQSYRLFRGLGDLPEAEAGLALWRMAAVAHADDALRNAVGDAPDWSTLRNQLVATQPGQAFLSAWDNFMSTHGHHCRGELELFNPRWSETPDYILEIVRGYLRAADQLDPVAQHRELARERKELTEQCENRLRNPLKRWIFARSLRRAQKLAVNREEWKNQAVLLLAEMRRLMLTLGERLLNQGTLNHADDIFFLRITEIQPVATHQAAFDVQAVIRERRTEYEHNLTLSPPPVVIGRYNPDTPPLNHQHRPGESLEGIAVSPGIVTGPARVILRTDDNAQVLPGEILVAPFTDPAWTPYFVTAAAVVMDQGGILSHGSIVAREYGLPAVTNVGSATAMIHTGDLIQVDGNQGRITLLHTDVSSDPIRP